jgi:uncharacterized protein YbcI
MPPDMKAQATLISNEIASLHCEHYGRGAGRVRTVIHRDYVATVLEEPYTPAERLAIANGEFRQVREMRTLFQDWMRVAFTKAVEEATGRPVRTFFSQVSEHPPASLEFFELVPYVGEGNGDDGLADGQAR